MRLLALIPLLALFSTGCLIIPAGEKDVFQGKQVKQEEITTIQPGMTTRAEILSRFGEPTVDFKSQRIIAYSWQMITAYMPWLVAGGYSAAGGIEIIPQPYVFLVAFDANDRVTQFEIKQRSALETVEQHTRGWVKRAGVAVPALVEMASPREAMIYVYRHGGFTDCPPPSIPAVRIDDKMVAQIHHGEYVARVVPPGVHTVTVDPDPDHNLKHEAERPIKSVAFEANAGQSYYIDVRISWGWGKLEPTLTIQPPSMAEPIVKQMTRTW